MSPQNAKSPETAGAARGALIVDRFAGQIDAVDTATILRLQYLARRTRLHPDVALVIAELAFGRAA